MRKVWYWLLAGLLLTPTPVYGQLGAVPYAFSPNTVILSAEVNTNFSTAYANALNRTGGTMTGTLTVQVVLPDGDNTRNLGSAGASFASAWFDGTVTLAVTSIANTGLRVLDTNASHTVAFVPGSNVTANRTLTLTTGDADRTITLNGSPTLNDWFDQSVKTTATPQFAQAGIGQASAGTVQLLVGGTFSPGGAGNTFGISVASDITAPANSVAGALLLNSSLTEAGSGTHALLSGLHVVRPTITGGAATVTDTASVYIDNAPSATVTGANYALWVDAGTTALDGAVIIGGTATLTGTTNLSGRVAVGTAGFDGDLPGNTSLTCDSVTEDTPSTGDQLVVRFTTGGSGNCILKGLPAPSAGSGVRLLWVLNATGQAIVFNNEDASEGTAANRIVNIGGLGLANGEAGNLVYDRTSSRWRMVR